MLRDIGKGDNDLSYIITIHFGGYFNIPERPFVVYKQFTCFHHI